MTTTTRRRPAGLGPWRWRLAFWTVAAFTAGGAWPTWRAGETGTALVIVANAGWIALFPFVVAAAYGLGRTDGRRAWHPVHGAPCTPDPSEVHRG